MGMSLHFPALCFDSLQGSCGVGRADVWKGEAMLQAALYRAITAGSQSARESLLLLGGAQ